MGCKVVERIDRRDIPRCPVQYCHATSTWCSTQYSTTTPAHQRWLLPNSCQYSPVFSPATGSPFPEKPTSHVMCLCRIAELIRHPRRNRRGKSFIAATEQLSCRRRGRMISTKSPENRDEERRPDGQARGYCRRWKKGAELNVSIFGR